MGLTLDPDQRAHFARQPVKATVEWLDDEGRVVPERAGAAMARLKKLYRGITTIVVDAADADVYLASTGAAE